MESLKISHRLDRRLKDTSHKSEDRRLQNCEVLKTEDLATKTEDQRYEFFTGKMWLLSVVN